MSHLVLLPLWALLWTIIPLLIWLGDQGPIFFRQQRAGKNGRPFTLVKFRTMIPGADREGPIYTVEEDPRVTKVGKFLRRTALDELPEVFNILIRDMSFVGPRALDTEEQKSLEQKMPGFEERLLVLPGLTGLAQIYDRTDDGHKKFLYDREYLNHMGLWLDSKLLVLSVWYTLTGRWDRRGSKPTPVNLDQTLHGAPPQQHESSGSGVVETDQGH